MLIYLMHNKQLKRPIKGMASTAYVLVDEYGVVNRALGVEVCAPHIKCKGQPIATFEVMVENKKAATESFEQLRKECQKRFNSKFGRIYERIFSSQSLTIAYIERQLEITRSEAKELLELLVKTNAYKKYYSYWVKGDAFAQWLSQQKG